MFAAVRGVMVDATTGWSNSATTSATNPRACVCVNSGRGRALTSLPMWCTHADNCEAFMVGDALTGVKAARSSVGVVQRVNRGIRVAEGVLGPLLHRRAPIILIVLTIADMGRYALRDSHGNAVKCEQNRTSRRTGGIRSTLWVSTAYSG